MNALIQKLAALPPDRTCEDKKFPFSFVTAKGPVRDENQDFVCAWGGPLGYAVLLVDGMGGMKAGREAALTTAATFVERLNPQDPNVNTEAIVAVFQRANSRIYADYSGASGAVAALHLRAPSKSYVAWVGDARAYAIGNNRIAQITQDDAVTGDDAYNYGLIQGIGCEAIIPDVHVLKLPDSVTRIALLSDGAYTIDDERLTSSLCSTSPVLATFQAAQWFYGKDNISVAFVDHNKPFPAQDFAV